MVEAEGEARRRRRRRRRRSRSWRRRRRRWRRRVRRPTGVRRRGKCRRRGKEIEQTAEVAGKQKPGNTPERRRVPVRLAEARVRVVEPVAGGGGG